MNWFRISDEKKHDKLQRYLVRSMRSMKKEVKPPKFDSEVVTVHIRELTMTKKNLPGFMPMHPATLDDLERRMRASPTKKVRVRVFAVDAIHML